MEPILPNFGFDSAAKPDWLCVPLNGTKSLMLVNGERCSVVSRSPSIVRIAMEDGAQGNSTRLSGSDLATSIGARQLVEFSGRSPGSAHVEVQREGRVLYRLEVAVKPRVRIGLSFHFVSDSAGHSTARRSGDLEETIKALNAIFEPQTNISFFLKRHFSLRLAGNLGNTVSWAWNDRTGMNTPENEIAQLIAKRDRSAHINIFFVWRNEGIVRQKGKAVERSSALGYSIGGREIYIEDWLGDPNRPERATQSFVIEDARMWAHEIGHVLGIDDVKKERRVWNANAGRHVKLSVNPHYVMGAGFFIPKRHAEIMSAIARQIAA